MENNLRAGLIALRKNLACLSVDRVSRWVVLDALDHLLADPAQPPETPKSWAENGWVCPTCNDPTCGK